MTSTGPFDGLKKFGGGKAPEGYPYYLLRDNRYYSEGRQIEKRDKDIPYSELRSVGYVIAHLTTETFDTLDAYIIASLQELTLF